MGFRFFQRRRAIVDAGARVGVGAGQRGDQRRKACMVAVIGVGAQIEQRADERQRAVVEGVFQHDLAGRRGAAAVGKIRRVADSGPDRFQIAALGLFAGWLSDRQVRRFREFASGAEDRYAERRRALAWASRISAGHFSYYTILWRCFGAARRCSIRPRFFI